MKTLKEKRESKKIQANKQAKFELILCVASIALIVGAITANVLINGVTKNVLTFVF